MDTGTARSGTSAKWSPDARGGAAVDTGFYRWYRLHEPFINEKTVDELSGRWWFTHKMLHRSVSYIKRAIPDLFSYTRYPNVPKSSNAIESFSAT